jgi:hypothetical protein
MGLSNVLATDVGDDVRSKFGGSISLLRAMHDEVINHPTNIKVFGSPVTKAMYGRIAAVSVSLVLSTLLRLVFAKTTVSDEVE